MIKYILSMALVCAGITLRAQTSMKIGYVDINYVFAQLPVMKQMESELKSTQNQLSTQYEIKARELEQKQIAYTQNEKSMIEAVRANSLRELQLLNDNLEKFKQEAQATIQNKEQKLMEPLQKNISKAIEEVAKENGYSFIFNPDIGGLDSILYADEKMNVSDLVLKKLGVTVKPAAAGPTPDR